jgi:hypothetical protein
MAKLRYRVDPAMPNAADEPWTKLATIVEYLQDGEPIPPDLASWLGEAIDHAKRDPAELLRRLGLKKKRGKPAADPDAWLIVGKRICDLEDFGLDPDEVRKRHQTKSNPEMLRPFGLNPDKFTPIAIGEIAYERMKPEAAILQVQSETFGKFERSQLQKFRDDYRNTLT